jgi:hypothetical protein
MKPALTVWTASLLEMSWYRFKTFGALPNSVDKTLVSTTRHSVVGTPPATINLITKADGTFTLPANTVWNATGAMQLTIVVASIEKEENVSSRVQTAIIPAYEGVMLYKYTLNGTTTTVSHTYADADPSHEVDLGEFADVGDTLTALWKITDPTKAKIQQAQFGLIDTFLYSESYESGKLIEGSITTMLTLGQLAQGKLGGLVAKGYEYIQKKELFVLDLPVEVFQNKVTV